MEIFSRLRQDAWNYQVALPGISSDGCVLRPLPWILGLAALVAGKRYFNGGANRHFPSLEGKYVIITGANTGIGLETAVELARLGAEVVVACRASEKTENAVKIIKERSGSSRVYSQALELDDLGSVEEFCRVYLASGKPLHILINNAGVAWLDKLTLTKDGFEQQFGVNYLAHALLTERLLPLLKKTGEGRIVHVSSYAHAYGFLGDFSNLNSEVEFSRIAPYCRSKLAQIAYSNHLNRRLQGTGVTSNALHPGTVRTEIGRHIFSNLLYRAIESMIMPVMYYTFKSPWYGAQTTLHVALSPECGRVGGKYYSDCRVAALAQKEQMTQDLEERFWAKTKHLLKLHGVD